MKARPKQIMLAVAIGIGVGLALLAGAVLVVRLRYRGAVSTPRHTLTVTRASSRAQATTTSGPLVTASATQKPSPTDVSEPEMTTYTVQEGDTLWYLAHVKFGTSIEAIKVANDLTSDMIQPGEVLTIPLSSVVVPTPTPPAAGEVVIHHVATGDVLGTIAEQYGVTVEGIMSANDLTSDAIQAGQDLVIPLDGEDREQLTPTAPSEDWQPSVLEGNLTTSYPLSMVADRFVVHYQPDSLPAREIDTIVARVERALNHLERTLDVNLDGRFDAYVAGSLFAPPNLALRGRSFSSQRRFFFLHDGTGTDADQQYILTHELTHLTTWNTMGRPISVMLHEGVAVYAGMELVKEADYVPIQTFCAAYQSINQLPRVSGSPSFRGHIRDLDTYYAAGCFVQHLIEEYSPAKFANVYHTGDFYGNYGVSLTELEDEWLKDLESLNVSFSFEPEALHTHASDVAVGYDRLFANFTGTPAEMKAYRELDGARMAVLEGRLDDAEMHLKSFGQLLATAE